MLGLIDMERFNLFKPVDIHVILKVGDWLAETSWFKRFYNKALQKESCRSMAQKNYHGYHPPLAELEKYPSNTLGYQYSQFIIKNNLTVYERKNPQTLNGPLYFRERSREFHDIIHVVYGFGVTMQDEMGINSVIIAQHKYPMSAVIIIGGLIQILFTQIRSLPLALKKISRGLSLGSKSESVFAIAWEDYWMSDLESLRQQMNVY